MVQRDIWDMVEKILARIDALEDNIADIREEQAERLGMSKPRGGEPGAVCEDTH